MARGAFPLDGQVVLNSPARLASHRLTSLPTVAAGRGSEVAFAPAQASQECGATLPIPSARGLKDRGGEKGRMGLLSGSRTRDRLRGKRGKALGIPRGWKDRRARGRRCLHWPNPIPCGTHCPVAPALRCASPGGSRGPRRRGPEPLGAVGALFRSTARGRTNRREGAKFARPVRRDCASGDADSLWPGG